ncbi:hypothetical protein GCM10027418_07600 [Mariniluteicoccus endophyticus]
MSPIDWGVRRLGVNESLWIWQIVLPAFFMLVLGIIVYVVFRPPKGFGPKVYLPRHLTPDQERNIARYILSGNRVWAIHLYEEMTGADQAEARYAIDHWGER